MSAPEKIQSQPATSVSDKLPRAGEPIDVARAVQQLRVLVCGLGVGLLLVSVALTAFVFKQNRNLRALTATRQHQVSQLQQSEQPLDYVVNELVKYSAGKPELMALLARHGIQMAPPSAAAPSQPSTVPAH